MCDKKKLIIFTCILVIIISIFVIISSFSFASPLENGTKVQEDSELTYYIDVMYDGKDGSAVSSSDSATAQVYSDYIYVEDRIPEELIFEGFVETDDGTIGAVKRSDNSSCSGYVVDGIGGLKYDEVTRTVSFRVKNLQAGCKITVGIITKTPSLGDKARIDFYNTAYGHENQFYAKSNTVHVFMGKEDIETYTVSYEYTGNVPNNAPELPTTNSYPADTMVGVSQSISLDGYLFSGWTTNDVEIVDDSFTMPAKNVVFTGSFTEQDQQTEKVTYTISGDVPDGYKTPKDKSYPIGSDVKLDSLQIGDVVNGYRFLGWTTNDVELPSVSEDESIIFTMPDHSVTLVGEFERISYKVTYQFQGDIIPPNSNSLLPKEENYYPGDKVATAIYPEAEGYRFLGWYYADEFEMPEEDIVIYGEWSIETGNFSPTIKKEIVDKKDYYHQGDIVTFKTTVTNTADFPIKDVILQEKGDGMGFVSGDGYEVLNSTFAKISSIPANSSVVVESRYMVGNDVVKEVTNTVELTGAIADNNYYLDTTKDYTSSVKFNVSNITLKINKTDEDGNSLIGAEFSLNKGESLYQIMDSEAVIDNVSSQYVASSDGIDFSDPPSDTNGKGVYTLSNTVNTSYPIHYYRGDIANNHVKFAGFCWKIVRTTDTGGVKLIYDGIPNNGICNNTGIASLIATDKFNENASSPGNAGYMYGEHYSSSDKELASIGSAVYGNDVHWDGSKYILVDTIESSDWNIDQDKIAQKYHYTCFSMDNSCSSVYYIHSFDEVELSYLTLEEGKNIEDAKEEMFTNITDSNIKQIIDNWYKDNLLSYANYLEDTVWCSNRNFYLGGLKSKDEMLLDRSYFDSYKNNVDQSTPTLTCSINDSFTVDSKNGNGNLTYPIALLTADEVTLAGHGYYSGTMNSYLSVGQYWFLMSPYSFNSPANVFGINSDGNLADYYYVGDSFGIRPSISLSSNVYIESGDGTSIDPYIVVVDTASNLVNSDSTSESIFSALEPNSTYFLRETKAPSGYQLLGKTLIVKVDSDGNVTIDGYDVDNQSGVASVSIVNKEINILPNTGGIGVIPYVILGLILISGGVFYFVKLFKKKGEKYEKNHK